MLDLIHIVAAVGGTLLVLYLLHMARQLAEVLLFVMVMVLGGLAWGWIGGPWGMVLGVIGIVPGGLLLVRALWLIRKEQPPAARHKKPEDDE